MAITRNPNLGPSQMRMRRRRLFLIRTSIVLFFLLVIILGLAIYSGHEKVKVQTIIVSGNAAVSSDAVLATANEVMAGRYFYLFARNNYLIFPRWEILERLLYEYRTIKEIDVSWESWQTISISIVERKPHSVWCGDSNQCFFVDKEGYIYSQAPSFSGTMFVKDYGNVSTSTGEIGQNFLSKQTYTQIFTLIDILDQKNMKVISVSFDGSDYKFTLENGPEIVFNNKNTFELSFQNLFSAIETGNLDLEKEANLIKYIDLRFDNKIVVGRPALLEPAGKK